MLRNYFPQRTASVLAQFRKAGLYPFTEPPVMNQRGGAVTNGFNLVLTAPQGIIYYTTNGTDPHTPITGLPNNPMRYAGPIPIRDLTLVKTRVLNGQYTLSFRESFSDGAWQTLQKVPRLIDDQPVVVSIPITNIVGSRFFAYRSRSRFGAKLR